LQKGLADKALDAFLEAAKRDDTNFMTQLMIGKLYLYGATEECNVIDLEKAEKHLLAAARYAKAEVAQLPAASRFAGEALLHAAIANYAKANDHGLNGNKAEAARLLQASLELAQQARDTVPELSEGHYHHAKFAALLGDGTTAATSLEKAIALDENYCIKVDADRDFRLVRREVNELFYRLREESGNQVRDKMRKAQKLLDDWVYATEEAESSAAAIKELLAQAQGCVARNTYFDNREAIELMQQANQIFHGLLVHKFAMHTLSAHTGRVTTMAFGPDQATLASGGSDCTIRVWNLDTTQLKHTLKGHGESLGELAFSHDGKLLASVDKRGGVKLWSLHTGRLLSDIMKPGNAVQCIAFSPDDTILAIGSYNRQATLWDTRDGALIQTLTAHKSSVDTIAFSRDGHLLATGSPDNTAVLWDLVQGKALFTFHGCSGLAHCLAFSPDDRLLISGANDGGVRFYNARTGRLEYALPERTGTTSWLSLSPDNQLLATINHGIALQIWDVANGKLLHNLKPFSPGITSLRFSPDNTLLVGNDYQDRSVKLWNVADGKLMHVIAGNLTCSAFNHDGTALVTGDETGSLRFWGRMVMTREAYHALQKRQTAAQTAPQAEASKYEGHDSASTSRPSSFERKPGAAATGSGAPSLRTTATRPPSPLNENRTHVAEPQRPKTPPPMASEPRRPAPASKPPEARVLRETPKPSAPPKPLTRPPNPTPRVTEIPLEPPRASNNRRDNTTIDLLGEEFDAPEDLNVHSEWQAPRRAPMDELAQELEPDTRPIVSLGGKRVETRSPFSDLNADRSSTPRPIREIIVEPAREPESSHTTTRYKKGTCQVCGTPLNFFAKICGVKLCKKHYF
jgi:WD40 repeat protein